jgi:hypothetical protein
MLEESAEMRQVVETKRIGHHFQADPAILAPVARLDTKLIAGHHLQHDPGSDHGVAIGASKLPQVVGFAWESIYREFESMSLSPKVDTQTAFQHFQTSAEADRSAA